MTPRISHRSSRFARGAAACMAIGMLATACGSDEEAASTSSAISTPSTAAETVATEAAGGATEGSAAPSSDEVCEDREALRDSVAELGDVDLTAEGTDGVTAAIDAVQEDLSALGDSASDELQPQVQAVQDGIDELETAVGNLGSGGAAEAATALSAVTGAVTTLLTSLDDGACG